MRRSLAAGIVFVALTLAGCASHHYLIQAKDGKEYVSPDKPVFVAKTQSWTFRDVNGNQWAVNREDVKAMETKPGTYKAPPPAAKAGPPQALAVTAGAATPVTITVRNETGNRQKVYLGFSGTSFGCYDKAAFAAYCSFDTANPWVCTFSLDDKAEKKIPFGKGCKVSTVFALNNLPWGPCPTTMAEFTLSDGGNFNQDTYDVSLVNGHNFNVAITPTTGEAIRVVSATGNKGNRGVYPLGCDACSKSDNPPVWADCPGKKFDAAECQGGDQYKPDTPCHLSQGAGASYEVRFGK
jgi:hypothetical protein